MLQISMKDGNIACLAAVIHANNCCLKIFLGQLCQDLVCTRFDISSITPVASQHAQLDTLFSKQSFQCSFS